MTTVDDLYKLVLYICDKNQMQGYISPDDFNLAINQAQKSYVSYLLGSFQQYTPQRPVARVEFGQNTTIRTRLAAIIYWYNLSVDGSGFAPYPGDYLQVDTMVSIYGYNRIRQVQQDALYSNYNSVIDPIATNPIYILEDLGFRFFPNNISQAKLSYIKEPPEIKWGYTLDGNGEPVYSPGDSKQPVWDDATCLDIVSRALSIIGVNLQFGMVQQYSMEIKNQGQ